MLTLHEAIREIQHELLLSSQERIQAGEDACFVTDKLTIELTCTFSEKKSSNSNASLNILSVLTAGSSKDKDISADITHKIKLELKTLEFGYDNHHSNHDAEDKESRESYKGNKSQRRPRRGFDDKANPIFPSDEV